MTTVRQNDETAVLVHWTYSEEEWKRFIKWQKRKKSFLRYTLYIILPKKRLQIPYVVITPNEVCTENAHECFNNTERFLTRIHIQDAGEINVMQITYEEAKGSRAVFTDIHVPVPKGKLREAIALQENLLLIINTGFGS